MVLFILLRSVPWYGFSNLAHSWSPLLPVSLKGPHGTSWPHGSSKPIFFWLPDFGYHPDIEYPPGSGHRPPSESSIQDAPGHIIYLLVFTSCPALHMAHEFFPLHTLSCALVRRRLRGVEEWGDSKLSLTQV